jgi:hypothetical protein
MPWPDDYILYSINVEDVRRVAEEEGFRKLTDKEIKQIGDKVGDHIEWHDAVLTAIREVAHDVDDNSQEDGDDE